MKNITDLSTIATISDVYQLLDERALDLNCDGDIPELWLRFTSREGISALEKDHSQWEAQSFLFSFSSNRLFSISFSSNENTITRYPDLQEYENAAWEYLKRRAVSASSAILLARYNHLLWKGLPRKDRRYAVNAINNYTHSIRESGRLLNGTGNRRAEYQIGTFYESLVSLCDETKSSLDELKALTNELLYSTSQLSFYARHGILEDMLKHPKIFKPADFESVLHLYEDQLKPGNQEIDDFMWVTHYLPTAVAVAQKSNKDVRRWYNEIGNGNLRLAAEETSEDRNVIKLSFYEAAIKAFGMAGNDESRRNTERLYNDLKPYIKLDSFLIEADSETQKILDEHHENLRSKAKLLLKSEPNIVYAAIATGSFFPGLEKTKKAAEPLKENAFLNFATSYRFDRNKNISGSTSAGDNKADLFETYMMMLHQDVLPFLRYIFVYGIKSGHLTAANFIGFLTTETWIGIPRSKTDLGGEIRISHWPRLLLPGIADFYNQFLAWGESKYYTPSFILCTDSLTVKLEGLLRGFCDRVNINTSTYKSKGMQEVLLGDILENATLKKYFNVDDQLLFEYVLSSKPGAVNLRNNIAHAFYDENEYYADQIILIIAIILRIGKYTFPKKTNPPSLQ